MSGLVRSARARPPAQRPRLRTPTAGVFAGRARCVHGLSHVSPDGQTPRMVDVSKKDVTLRTAVARSEVELPPHGEDPLPLHHTTPADTDSAAAGAVASALLGEDWQAKMVSRGETQSFVDPRSKKGPVVYVPSPTLSPLPLPSNLDHLLLLAGRAGRRRSLRACRASSAPPSSSPSATPYP